MNAKRIKWIIWLMSLALIGIICLQIYWIGWNIRLNEAQFDKTVFEALNRVADRLRTYDAAQVIDEVKVQTQDSSQFDQTDVAALEIMKANQLGNMKSLAERIPLDLLQTYIEEELSSRGISSPNEYGIYSKSRESYVIVNDHFVVEESGPQIQYGGAPTLYNSPYRVSLFTGETETPGHLSLYFPNRATLVLGSALGTLLLSILFTGIILFCFWYTIQVIFRQKQLSEIKTDFINNMTHEFKTPIATISLAADSISNPTIINNPDKIRRFTEIIRQENRRMNSQVERVLQVAMIDKKDFELRISDVNLHEMIEQVALNFSLQVEKREGSLTTDLQSARPIIQGDATHIASVIHNLLDNANKYSLDKPEIKVLTRDTPIGVEITVQDKGIGINKEVRKHIFDKFYRAHTGNVHDVKGFGLGLSYVKAILTAHNGLVDVKSELGKGSAFSITFPN